MPRPWFRGWPYVAMSVVAHLALLAALSGSGGARRPPRRVSEAYWIEPEPAPTPQPAAAAPEPAPAPEPEPIRPAPRAPRVRSKPARNAPSPPAEAAQQAPASPPPSPSTATPEPADFSGLTLTNADGPGWQSAQGSGRALHGPVGPAGARGEGEGAGGAMAAEVPPAPGPALVPASDLSRPPTPPDLDGSLRALYPESARRQGLEGDVRVSVTVLPSGRLGRLRVLAASDPRFAAACTQMLRGSRWSPPLDRAGEPVGTVVAYRCQFLLD